MKKFNLIIPCAVLFCVFCTSHGAAQDSSKLPEAPAAKTQSSQPPASAFKDQKEKISYAIGIFLAARIRPQAADFDPSVVAQALKEGLSGGKTLMSEDEAVATLNQWQTEMKAKEEAKRAEEGAANQKAGDAFLAANKTKDGVVTTASGLQYKILVPGTGPKPTANDTVVVNYKGTLLNGTEFDSSSKHGSPLTHSVTGLIPGWTEALQLMPVGSKWQLFIPGNLAYGARGAGGDIGPNATLIFEVELLSIQPQEAPANPATANPPASTAPKDKPPTK